MSPVPRADRSANVAPADDELTELLAQLLERAWRRRHADEAQGLSGIVAARTGSGAPR
jgi:hypothetical protein